MSIKVGQIYQEPGEYGFKYVITKVRPYNGEYYHAICDDGYVLGKLFEIEIKQDNFIAEYPTWQEAVNSEYFKND